MQGEARAATKTHTLVPHGMYLPLSRLLVPKIISVEGHDSPWLTSFPRPPHTLPVPASLSASRILHIPPSKPGWRVLRMHSPFGAPPGTRENVSLSTCPTRNDHCPQAQPRALQLARCYQSLHTYTMFPQHWMFRECYRVFIVKHEMLMLLSSPQ